MTCGGHGGPADPKNSTAESCSKVSPGWGTFNSTHSDQSDGLDPVRVRDRVLIPGAFRAVCVLFLELVALQDVTMAGVARHSDRFFSHDLFYKQAAEGTLPAFSWISPPHEAAGENCPLSHIPGRFHDIERDEFCQDRLGSNVKETQKHGGDSHFTHRPSVHGHGEG